MRRLSKSMFPPVDNRSNGQIKLTGNEVSGGKINFNVNVPLSHKGKLLSLHVLQWRITFPFKTPSNSLPIN